MRESVRTPSRIEPVLYFYQMMIIGFDLYIVAPLLPALARQFHRSIGWVGLFVTAFSVSYALFSPLFGKLSTQFGRKVLAIFSLVIFSGAGIFSALSVTGGQFLASRIAAGIGASGFTPTLYAYIADRVPYSKRARMMSYASSGLASATLLGVPLGILVQQFFGWPAPFWIIVVGSVISGVLVVWVWDSDASPSRAVTQSFRVPTALLANLTVTALVFTASGIVYTYAASYLESFYHAHGRLLAILLGVLGAGGFLGTLAQGALADRWGKHSTIRWGIYGQLVSLAFLALQLHPVYWAALGLFVFAFCGSYIPALKAIVSHHSEHGQGMAWNNAALYGGLALGSWLGGRLWTSGMLPLIVLSGALLIVALWVMDPRFSSSK